MLRPAAADEASPQASAPALVHIEGDLGPAAALGELLSGRDDFAVEFSEGAGLLRVDGFALALSDGRTATERSLALGEPVVLFDLALDYGACARVALAAAAQATDAHLAKAIGLFTRLGKKVSLLADVPGMAVTRTVAMLVNEAADAVQQGIASADDVDAAMQKGVNYPIGPMAWGRQIGLGHVATGAAASRAGLRRGPLSNLAVAATCGTRRAAARSRAMAEFVRVETGRAASASSRSPAPSAAMR